MVNSSSILLLIQELGNDLGYIQDASALCERAEGRLESSGWSDEMDLLALGSTLHNLYNAFEGYFMRVAKFFENDIDKLSWNRDLLDRMGLEIPGVRPALITNREMIERLDELRRFRHLFRNLYKTKLHPAKVRIVLDAASDLATDFKGMHEGFIVWLGKLAEEIAD